MGRDVSIGSFPGLAYIARTLTTIDPEKERQRLAKVYADMSDGELEKLAQEEESLTEIARSMLRAEIARRGMNAVLVEPTLPEKGAVESRLVTMEPTLATVGRYRDVPEALMAKSLLDSAGIESFLADDNIVWMDWFYSNAVGGVKLRVRAEDAPTAIQLLAESMPEEFDVEGVGTYTQPRCPNCQSLNVSLDELIKPVAYGTLAGVWLLGLVPAIPLRRTGWKCHACGHEWEEADNEAGPENVGLA